MLQANVSREDVKYAVCGLPPEQKLDQAKNQSRATVKSDRCKANNF